MEDAEAVAGAKKDEGLYRWLQERVCVAFNLPEEAFQRLLASEQRYAAVHTRDVDNGPLDSVPPQLLHLRSHF